MDKQRLIYLFKLYQTERLSKAEQLEWNAILHDPTCYELLTELFDSQWELPEGDELATLKPKRSSAILDFILAHRQHKRPAFQLWRAAASIAAVLFILAGTGYLFLIKGSHPQAYSTDTGQAEILPGGNKAYLVLADGKRIVLDGTDKGEVATQFGTRITKTGQGALLYRTSSNQAFQTNAQNTIQTPNGGQYQIVLPDGSHVWLNANSSLRYPVAFSGTTREVTLTGEAYFEVAKDKAHPFIVNTATQSVKVLGTHFNVSSYANEGKTYTTLVEGSVTVNSNQHSKQLRPGEQSVLADNKIMVSQVNTRKFIAWKDGTFNFNGDDIKSIMRQLQRWYDFEVSYQGELPEETFYGEVSRYKNISQVFKMLSATKIVAFKVDGRKVIVTVNEN